MSTYGPRFSGGYQFPRTHAASLRREPPIKGTVLAGGATIQVVPLTGGRATKYDVCASWRDEHGVWVSSTYVAEDLLEASAEYARVIARLGG